MKRLFRFVRFPIERRRELLLLRKGAVYYLNNKRPTFEQLIAVLYVSVLVGALLGTLTVIYVPFGKVYLWLIILVLVGMDDTSKALGNVGWGRKRVASYHTRVSLLWGYMMFVSIMGLVSLVF